jgi:integrase
VEAIWQSHSIGRSAKAELGAIRGSILGAGADRPISPVPTSCGIRSPTAPVHGSPLATTSMRQSRRRSASRRISKLSTQTSPVVQDQDESGRTKITDAVYQWFAELQLFQGKDQQGKSDKTLRAYNYRLGFFLDFTVQQNLRFLDQIDRNQLLRYVKFLREHDSDLDDRTVHNIFETLNTFLRTRDILIAGQILAELDYAEKPPKPYTKHELKDMFAAMDDEEKLLYGLFLNSGVRDAEMQNTEYADLNWEKCTLHVQPKAWRKFRLKGKSKKKSAKDRFAPIPAKLVWKIKDRMRERNAQPHDLLFPNGKGKPDGHFLPKLKAIAKKAGVESAELHRFRKTYADTLHEEGVSVNTIRIRLGHESLDVTLAYLKGKDAESEEAQEHANSSSLALYA